MSFPSSPVASLPSSPTTSSADSEDNNDAEREWTESLEQLELLLTMVVVPYLGKYFGRKCAYWGESEEERGLAYLLLRYFLSTFSNLLEEGGKSSRMS